MSETLNESQLITAKNNLIVIEQLANTVREIGNRITVSDSSAEDSVYGSLNNTEKVLLASDKIAGALIGVASIRAGSETQDYFGYDEDSTTQNAFKHALWNAFSVAYSVNEEFVKNFTDAHEFGNPNNYKSSDSFEATRMDMHNNAIGRSWGKDYSLFTAGKMNVYMDDETKTTELWIIKSRPPEKN